MKDCAVVFQGICSGSNLDNRLAQEGSIQIGQGADIIGGCGSRCGNLVDCLQRLVDLLHRGHTLIKRRNRMISRFFDCLGELVEQFAETNQPGRS